MKTMIDEMKRPRRARHFFRDVFIPWLFSWGWITAERGVHIETSPFGVTLTADPAFVGRAATAAAAAGSGNTPFKAEIDPNDPGNVAIGVNRDSSPYVYGQDSIRVGLDVIHKTTAESITVSNDGWVYYDIYYDTSSVLTATLMYSFTHPWDTTEPTGHWYVPICHVATVGGAPTSVAQIQYGYIEMPGRFA